MLDAYITKLVKSGHRIALVEPIPDTEETRKKNLLLEGQDENKVDDVRKKKKPVTLQNEHPDLFGGLFEENTSGEATVSQDNELNRKFAMTVKDDMLAALDNGTKPYRSILDLRKRASGLGMEVDNDGRTDILLQELVEDGLVRAAREVVERHGSDSKATVFGKQIGFLATFGFLGRERFTVQNYCGREKCQAPPLAFGWRA